MGNTESRSCNLDVGPAWADLSGWVVSSTFLATEGELILEQFLFHENLAPRFTANLHNTGATKGTDVTHYGVHRGVCYFWQFYAAWTREWGTAVDNSKALCRLEKICSQVALHAKPGGTALSRRVFWWRFFSVSYSNIGKVVLHRPSVSTAGGQGQRNLLLCSLAR